MLDQMRKQSQSAIMVLLFGFIIFVFVFSFGSGSQGFRQGGCGRASVAAMVNGEAISEMNYQFHYDQQLMNVMGRRGEARVLRKEDKIQLRQQVLDTLVDQSLLIQAARESGLRVTPEERNEAIRNSPLFKSDGGRFDFQRYKLIVQRYYHTTPLVFEDIWTQQMLAARMAELIQGSARVTDEELEQSYRLAETKVDLEFVSLTPAQFKESIQPTDAELDAFLTEHMDRVEAAYRAHEDRFHKPKKVQLAHIFFAVGSDYDEDQERDKRERAEITLDDLKKGADFAVQAKEYSEDDATREKGGELPLLARDELSVRWGEPVAEAAFALEEGGLSGLVRSPKGFHVLKALKVEPAIDRVLPEVQRELAREVLVDETATAKAKAEAERLLAGLKAGKSLADQLPAPAEGDEPGAIQARRTGPVARKGGFIPQLGLDRDLARAAFDLTEESPIPDRVFEVKSPFGTSLVVMRLAERLEPDMKGFAEAKAALREQVMAQRGQRQLAVWLQERRQKSQVEVNQRFLMDTRPAGMRGSGPVPTDDY